MQINQPRNEVQQPQQPVQQPQQPTKPVKGELVLDTGLNREPGFLYFIDKNCNIRRSPMKNYKPKSEVQ